VVGLRITAVDVEGSIAAAANSVQLTGNQTIAGTKTFSNQIVASGGVQGNVTGDVSGNAGTVTNGVYTTGDQTIAGVKTFSNAPVLPGLNGGQLAGMRNKIINGKMEIAQRGTSFPALGVTATYTLDRWFYGSIATTGVVTVSQQADAPSINEFQNSLRVAVTTADTSIAAGDASFVYQRVEGFNTRDLIGRAFTVSFWVRSSKTGVHCLRIGNAGGDRSYVAEYSVNVANTWEQKSITVSGGLITAGTWAWANGVGLELRFSLAAGSDFQTTAGTWQTGNFSATANQVNCLDTVNNIFAITGVQLEVGSVATPFEHRPIGAELALCQRYFERGSTFGQSAVAGDFGSTIPYKATKRASPTLAFSSITYSSASTLQSTTGVIADSTAQFAWNAAASGTSGFVAFNWTSASEL